MRPIDYRGRILLPSHLQVSRESLRRFHCGSQGAETQFTGGRGQGY